MSVSTSALALEFASRTHTGLVREANEDALRIAPELGLAIVADGLGGCAAGEVASDMAVRFVAETLAQAFRAASPEEQHPTGRLNVHVALEDTLARCNEAILDAAAQREELGGMATTLVAALFYGERLALASVGDSRLYRLRAGRIEQLTRDHTLLQDQVDCGMVCPDAARASRNRTLLTQALGADEMVKPDVRDTDAAAGDVFLLCSDGLTDQVDDETICGVLADAEIGLQSAAGLLVQRAIDSGGLDNVSVILVRTTRPATQRGLLGSLAGLLA